MLKQRAKAVKRKATSFKKLSNTIAKLLVLVLLLVLITPTII